MLYSAVSQPTFLPFRKGGTLSSMDAVQITRVPPQRIRQLPSAVPTKPTVISQGRSSLGFRLSGRDMIHSSLVFCSKEKSGK